MRVRLTARSISRSVREDLLREASCAFHVLAVFNQACDLVGRSERGPARVIAVVTPEIGNGPLNIVVDESWDLSAIEPGMRAQANGDQLDVAGLTVDLSEAEIWDPRPNWVFLRAHHATIALGMRALGALCRQGAPPGSLLHLLDKSTRDGRLREEILAAAIWATEALRAGWGGDLRRLHAGANHLAGLGSGLTPAGDDFLCGAMLWAWLIHPRPAWFSRALTETAAPKTTTLSAALLRAAARGECSVAWHALFEALARGHHASAVRAVGDLLAQGATSGADTLAGFIWAATTVGPGKGPRAERIRALA